MSTTQPAEQCYNQYTRGACYRQINRINPLTSPHLSKQPHEFILIISKYKLHILNYLLLFLVHDFPVNASFKVLPLFLT